MKLNNNIVSVGGLKIVQMVLALITTIVLAKFVNIDVLGEYIFYLSIAGTVIIPIQQAFSNNLLQAETSDIGHKITVSRELKLYFSVLSILFVALIINFLVALLLIDMLTSNILCLFLAICITGLTASIALLSSYLHSYNRVALSLLPDIILKLVFIFVKYSYP